MKDSTLRIFGIIMTGCLMVTSSFSKDVTATFFVSTDGNNAWSGKRIAPNAEQTDGPFATLSRARNAVREMKNKDGRLKEPVTIMVRGGKYYMNDTLVMSKQDSGTADFRITYAAYPGEKPVLSGGKKITGWQPHKDKILKCQFTEAKGGKWKFRQLFYNGKRQIRSRTPNFDPENPIYGGLAFAERPLDGAFKYKPGTFSHPSHANPTEGEVNTVSGGFRSIAGIDEPNRIISGFSLDENWHFIVENLLEELDQPDEWCLYSGTGTLYFWPPDELDQTAEVVAPSLVCLIDLQGVSYVTISGFTITETGMNGSGGMPFRDGYYYGDYTASLSSDYCGEVLHLRDTTHCTIENNHFDAVGSNAIFLEGYNAWNIIQHNEISYPGLCGVLLVGTPQQHPMFNQVLDNHIHHCSYPAMMSGFVAGVFLGISEGNVVGHNYIHHVPNQAINLSSNCLGRNIIEYNEIRHTALDSSDGGAINSWMYSNTGEPPFRRDLKRMGHIIRCNLIADTWGCCWWNEDGSSFVEVPTVPNWPTTITKTSMAKPTFGIYLDAMTSNCHVYGNIIVRSGTGICIHNGENNLIENNIIDGRLVSHLRNWHINSLPGGENMLEFLTGTRFSRNIVYTNYPDAFLYLLTDCIGYLEAIEESDYNLFFNAAGGEWKIADEKLPYIKWGIGTRNPISLTEWQKKGYDTHSMVGDPLFVDRENDDFNLQPDSPVWGLGFKPIDINRIGIRRKETND